MKAFLDYYRTRGIIPVRQHIPDLVIHFRRRAGLLRQLGIPYRSLQGARCLEFGPGTGQNALFTLACEPDELVLVDANPESLRETAQTLSDFQPATGKFRTVESTIEDFHWDPVFDFVLCEGVIPFQNDPVGLARAVAEPVAPGGLLVITCVDGVSYFAEVLRRTLKPWILRCSGLSPDASGNQAVEALVRFFTPDLQSLPAMSRVYEDWVLDVILHPYRGGCLFPLDQAVNSLADRFDVQGTSPGFIEDWRWFKEMTDEDPGRNALALENYRRKGAAFIDCRMDRSTLAAVTAAGFGASLQALCCRAYDRHFDAWDGDSGACDELARIAEEVASLLKELAPLTTASIEDWLGMVNALRAGTWAEPDAFAGWFGRGQQYLSFIRREGF